MEEESYLVSVKKQFRYYKLLGDKTFNQIEDKNLFWQYNSESNSIAIIIQHLHGNMLSRWTDFLTVDGEKDSRNRDREFEVIVSTKTDLLQLWESGWQCFFYALDNLSTKDLSKIIYIRNMGHTVTDAINRQLAHYAYHVGQIVFIGKMISSNHWNSLSIPRGGSIAYNSEKFSQSKHQEHFTDEFIIHKQPDFTKELENEYVKLIPLKESDSEILYQLASDPLIWEQHPIKERYKRAIFQSYIESALESKSAYLIWDKKTNLPIGCTRFYDYNSTTNTILIGYTFIIREFWGTGINSKIKKLMLDYIFNYVDKVFFHIGENNLRSQKAIEKIGAFKVRELYTSYNEEESHLNYEYCINK